MRRIRLPQILGTATSAALSTLLWHGSRLNACPVTITQVDLKSPSIFRGRIWSMTELSSPASVSWWQVSASARKDSAFAANSSHLQDPSSGWPQREHDGARKSTHSSWAEEKPLRGPGPPPKQSSLGRLANCRSFSCNLSRHFARSSEPFSYCSDSQIICSCDDVLIREFRVQPDL